MFQFKRFVYDPQSENTIKDDREIAFPFDLQLPFRSSQGEDEVLDYSLVAVIVHTVVTVTGHLVTNKKKNKKKKKKQEEVPHYIAYVKVFFTSPIFLPIVNW